jgi:hypothetical protein
MKRNAEVGLFAKSSLLIAQNGHAKVKFKSRSDFSNYGNVRVNGFLGCSGNVQRFRRAAPQAKEMQHLIYN